MCVVSMVHGHFQTPLIPVPHWPPLVPHIPTAPAHPEWTLERWHEYQELLRKARQYDERTGQFDCPDPAKEVRYQEIQKMIEERYGLQPVKP